MTSIIFISLLLCGCSIPKQHVTAPSTAAVQGSINSARQSNASAQGYNDRIDAKAAVIHKYWDSSK